MSESADGGAAAAAMGGKENAPPGRRHLVGSIEEQRARITQNFRAAKALSSRKKPRLLSHPLPTDENVGAVARPAMLQDPPVRRRIPLSESWMARRFPSFSVENTIPPQETCVNDDLSSLDHGSERSDVSARLDVNLDDDELDESILREIDEICEQRSAGKIERPSIAIVPPDCYLPCRNDLGGRNVASDVMEVGGDEGGESVVRSVEEKETSCLHDNTSFPVPQAFLDYWRSLNDKQREASCFEISVPLMIMAGPGSGKTSTMVGRVLMLLKEGVRPSNILAMTFTTAAASEMRDRISAVVGKAISKELAISTFHSFSLHLCRLYAEKLGRTTEFLIYGHKQQRRAVVEAFRLLEGETKDVESIKKHSNSTMESFKIRSTKWEKFVIQAKAAGRTPDDCRKKGDQLGAGILSHYNDILRSCNALDYHDLIICSVKLLTDFPDVFKECQESWKAIVVDEFQDTSAMQYKLLRLLASHNCITVIGDDDQSIFSFNGANVCSFDSFCKDFATYKEVRLAINYRSTRFIVEAASHLIQNNSTRCQLKEAVAYNSHGSKIIVKDCQNDASQCAFVVDKIMEITSSNSITKHSFGDIAILYRRQVTGKAFQTFFRDRNIPFNIHGVAFYRKKVTKAIIAILQTILPCFSEASAKQSFKTLLLSDKEDKKKVIEYVDKISMARKCGFLSAANEIFHAKVSGTLKRAQLLQGRKVLSTLEMLSKLVLRERSITAVVSSVANMIPHRYLLEKRAVVDVHDGKYLNEDHDIRSVFNYLLDDVSEFVSTYFSETETLDGKGSSADGKGCSEILEAFLDFISTRERENFQSRKRESENSVTLTTIHQSKGLEWDTVFIVKANESEIPLLHEYNGVVSCGASLEEERRLLYVAMTRARKKLYILYVLMDSNWQFLQPSRFLKEIPDHLIEGKIGDAYIETERTLYPLDKSSDCAVLESRCKPTATEGYEYIPLKNCEIVSGGSSEISEAFSSNTFLKRFKIDERSIVSHIFHKWAKKPIFQNPKRLLDKVGFVIDERLRNRTGKNKDLLRILKTSLGYGEAFQYAQHVLMWEHIPIDKRAHLIREKQEYFQKQRIENAMGSSMATDKQISYLQMLGCTTVPTSRLHASRLIEQYKAL